LALSRGWAEVRAEQLATLYRSLLYDYTPGKQNQVADALSRQNVNALEYSGDSDIANIHNEESLIYTIETTHRPLNYLINKF